MSAYRSRSPKESAAASALPSAATPGQPHSVQYEPESAEYHRAVSDGALGALTAQAEDEMDSPTYPSTQYLCLLRRTMEQ